MLDLPGLQGSDHGNVSGYSVVQALVHFTLRAGARIVAEFHPQCLPWTTCKIVADQSQETAKMKKAEGDTKCLQWWYIQNVCLWLCACYLNDSTAINMWLVSVAVLSYICRITNRTEPSKYNCIQLDSGLDSDS